METLQKIKYMYKCDVTITYYMLRMYVYFTTGLSVIYNIFHKKEMYSNNFKQ